MNRFIRIKVARRTLMALTDAYTVSIAFREVNSADRLGLLLYEHAVEFRNRLSEILFKKECKNYTLDLSRSEAAALHFYWIDQPIHSHDGAQAVNALLAAIDQWRKSPHRLIPQVL